MGWSWFWCTFYILMVLKILLCVRIGLPVFKKNVGGFRTLWFFWDGSENKIMVFNNENNDFNPLTDYYFSPMAHLLMFIGFLIHLCWFYFRCISLVIYYRPVDVCLLEFGNGSIGTGCGICSELVTKTPQRCRWCSSGLFVVCFRHVLNYCLLFGYVGLCGAYLL